MAGQPWMKLWIGDLRKDPKFAMLTAESKGVWLLIIGAMHESDSYKLTGTVREIAKQAQVETDEMERSIREIQKYDVANVEWDKSNIVTVVSRRRYKDYEKTEYERERKKKYRVGIKENTTSHQCPIDVPLSDSDSDSINSGVKDKSASEIEEKESFEEVYDLYQKKTGKVAAQKAWKRIAKKDHAAIMDHIPAFVLATPEKKYRPNLSTYLNQRHFEDEELPQTTEKNERPLTARQLAGTPISEQLHRGGFAPGPGDDGRTASLAIQNLYRRKRPTNKGTGRTLDGGDAQPPLLEG